MASHAQPNAYLMRSKSPSHFSPHLEAPVRFPLLESSLKKTRLGLKLNLTHACQSSAFSRFHGGDNSCQWWHKADSHSKGNMLISYPRRRCRRPRLQVRSGETCSQPLADEGRFVSNEETVPAINKQQPMIGDVSCRTNERMIETAVIPQGAVGSQEYSHVNSNGQGRGSNGASRSDVGIVVPVRGRMAHAMKAATSELGSTVTWGPQGTPLTQIYKPDGRVIRCTASD